jgi:hypothetical protein
VAIDENEVENVNRANRKNTVAVRLFGGQCDGHRAIAYTNLH